ncbi:site-specific DNA-methyltransferase [Lentibacillus sp. CBA3610]|uniref:site-specific DNA-methyltransferase n=1 Tax=Lentibacillus sp. CBA3610 TaxID=2518176 RepID=UPI0015957C81|nr:site-specific DNA-methyltransferase [Lentibacillus sp. CBA3610]QKY71360.1 hypothetical protein Len3610_18990 [Lentibacillus sp. CBA3610]
MRDNSNLKELVFEALRADERLWDDEGKELNQRLLIDLIDSYDKKVINILLSHDGTRNKFFVQINGAYVFKTNDFKFFMEENKIDNSYTDFINRIGLSDNQEFINSRGEVVVNFPYKDCILAGGQATEEGEDIYFGYEGEKVKTVKGEKVVQPAGFREKQAKRNEVFFNEVLAHDEIDRLLDEKAFVNWSRFTTDGKSEITEFRRDENGYLKDNIVIKGNNLIALH